MTESSWETIAALSLIVKLIHQTETGLSDELREGKN